MTTLSRLCLAGVFALTGLAHAQNGLTDIPDTDVEAQLKAFKLPEGMEINLYASDPMISKPVHMNWDAEGRLWLVSSPLYPHIAPGEAETDRVLVLEDTDEDGAADKATTFATDLHIPTAIVPGDGGAYVANSTEMLFLKDTDGDLVADERRILLSGFGTEDTHHLIHTFMHGPDGLLYFNQSIYIHSHVETPHGIRRLLGGGIWHYRPETQQLEVLAKGLINPWGFAFNRYGQTFATDGAGSEGINFIFPRAVFRTSPGAKRVVEGLNPGQPKHCGLEVMSGAHVPDEMQGHLLAPDFRGHRVNRFALEEEGSFYKSTQQEDLLASTHRAFRPIDVKMGPDGAIYVADWYNPIIQHGEVDFRDPRRDRAHGRIWRIAFKDRPLVEKPDIVGADVEGLLDMLKAREGWTRHFAKQELRQRGLDSVKEPLLDWASAQKNPAAHMEALWALQGLNHFDQGLFDQLVTSKNHRYRAAALRVLYHRHEEVEAPMEVLKKAIGDRHPQVRLWAISGLAQLGGTEAVDVALKALDQSVDRMIDFALWSIVREHQGDWVTDFNERKFTLKGRDYHLLFAANAIEKPLGMGRIFAALRAGEFEGEERKKAIDFIARAGNPTQLAELFAMTVEGGAPLSTDRLVVLDALIQARQSRKISPAGDLNAIVPMVKANDPAVVQRAALLAGLWKVAPARAELVKSFRQGGLDMNRLKAVAEGLRSFGGQETLKIFEEAALNSSDWATRAVAVNQLVSMAPQRAANAAVKVLASSPEGDDPFGIYDTFLRKPQTIAALTKALGGAELPQDIAILGVQRAGTSGGDTADLIAALQNAADLKPMTQTLSPEEMEVLVGRVMSEGNPHRGEKVYRIAAMQCMVCHAIGGVGGKIGPDMVSIGASAPVDYLITSLLNPNDKIKEGYHMTLVTTKSGASFAGGVESESDTEVVLRDNLGNLHRVPKADVASKVVSPVSMMPAGLTASLREDQFIDLVRFLSELGKEGEFKTSPAPLIREWSAMLPHDRTRDDIGHYGQKIFAEDFEGYDFIPFGSKVNGDLPLDELPKVKGRGNNRYGVVRFTVDADPGETIGLKINDTQLASLFAGAENEIELPEKGPATVNVTVPEAGTPITLTVNSVYRKKPVNVEVVTANQATQKPAASNQAQQPKPKPQAKPRPKPKPKVISFKEQQLHKDNNEGIAIGDIDKDGDTDIVSGEFWYENPEWKQRRVREIGAFGADYMENNGDHLYDVDGDGFLDVVAGSFIPTEVFWFRNPGAGNYDSVDMWEKHLLVDTETSRNELTLMHDVDGDGTPEYLENSWNDANPMLIWSFARDEDGKPTLKRSVAGMLANGHGMGMGDITGDGHDDIIFKQGFYEHPGENPLGQTWELRKEFTLPHAGAPIIVVDLNEDGLNDMIWGDGHNYGLYWEEQLKPREDGTTVWRQHLIDKKFSQAHAQVWEDIDNDGEPELITGKRYYAHSGRDPGAEDPIVINVYDWDKETLTFKKTVTHTGQAGTGLQIRVADLNEDGWKDLILPGKSGTHILWNQGIPE